MSPLTKLFVVLLVLVSVILTAGVVTFVNKLDPLQDQLQQAKDASAASQALLNRRTSDVDTLNAQLEAARAAAAVQAQALNKDIGTLRTTIEARDAEVASTKTALASLTSANSSQSSALQMSEDSKTHLQEQVTGLRKDADERLRQVADLNTRVSTLTAQNSVLERERRNLSEQLTEVQGKTDQMGKMLLDMGVSTAQVAKAGTRMGAPAINGVIRSRRTIAGKEYATISIGSQDLVTKGMEFKIISKETGTFLGILTVDVVDANEAMGQIVADQNNLAQIRAGNVVRTQI
ncbi:MAG: hypothetical protein H7144_16785 [Burkholderiales bacterium]|nr:hypothetical protein [Phycisphaerae bacterium]